MAEKYLKIGTNGLPQEVEATVESEGLANAGQIPALDGGGRLDNSVMPTGVSASVLVLPLTESVANGDFVNVYDAGGGTMKVRKADASNNRPAHGYVKGALPAEGEPNVTVYLDSLNTDATGVTVGGKLYFLSADTAGAATDTPPDGSGEIVQPLGYGHGANILYFAPGYPITRA
jgi:hypothetical protein